MHRIVIVGGGMAGLAAAWELAAGSGEVALLVLEGSDRLGGKLRQERIAGRLVDVGAESMLAVRPEARQLIGEIGAGDQVVSPATTAAAVFSYGALHPLPPRSLMGIPRSPADALGILSAAGIERLARPRTLPPLDGDVAVGGYVAQVLGDEVVDRLVEPLLGGVYAGDSRRISLAAALPQLYARARAGDPLLDPASAVGEPPIAPRSGTDGSVFIGLDGGVGRLPGLVAAALRARGVTLRTGTIVRELRAGQHSRWELVTGPTIDPEIIDADAVIIAVPPAPTRRLLGSISPAAADGLAAVETASMVIVTFAFPAGELLTPPGSGFLVPPVEGRGIKAATFSSAKWAWLAAAEPDTVFVRASMGRHGAEADLQADDETLATRALAELSAILDVPLPTPIDTHVQRWGGGLPQYAVGHLERIALVRKAISEVAGLEVAGAAYDGVGIPAVIGSGRAAARALRDELTLRQ